ncbi:MAG TPA: HAMP domain-containing protein, partial [Candidatus Enterenecus avicola]|nr:HAMP domain-containing protein [Candidatus Enterenecus avicola]
MKLWQKIFLSTLALMVGITALSSVLLLRSTRDALWQREQQRAVTQQQYLAGILKAGILNQRLRLGVLLLQEEQTRESAIQTLEQQTLDNYLAGLMLLDQGDKAVWSQLPAGVTPPTATDEALTQCQLQAGDESGEWYLVCAMPLTLEAGEYRLVAAYAVGDLQQELNLQALRAVGLSLGMSLLAAVGLLLLVRRLLRPLGALQENARSIAEGNYDQRLDIPTRDELADLAQDMNALAQAVQERVEQLEQVAEERRVFVANLAHEMKTPLTSIMGYADLLYLPKTVSDPQRVEYSGIILEEAKRLRSLSAKLLELL